MLAPPHPVTPRAACHTADWLHAGSAAAPAFMHNTSHARACVPTDQERQWQQAPQRQTEVVTGQIHKERECFWKHNNVLGIAQAPSILWQPCRTSLQILRHEQPYTMHVVTTCLAGNYV